MTIRTLISEMRRSRATWPQTKYPPEQASKLSTNWQGNSLNRYSASNQNMIIRTNLQLKSSPFGTQHQQSLIANHTPFLYRNQTIPGQKVVTFWPQFHLLKIYTDRLKNSKLQILRYFEIFFIPLTTFLPTKLRVMIFFSFF